MDGKQGARKMNVLHPRCAGLDVHKKTVVAAVRIVENGQVRVEVRTFETTTAGLIALAEWLSENGVTTVAMEATGVYWKPVWHILSTAGSFELVLANAQHVKAVPGRKRDVSDAVWLAELQAHGLIRGSFVPPPEVAELRSLMRTRKQLVRERTSHTQRIHKTLEEANIKLDSVISDVLGQSGRAMLEAMISGESDPKRLAELASPRIKAAPETLRRALDGRLTEVHRTLLRIHLDQIEALDRSIAVIERRAEDRLDPFREAVELIVTIPGMGEASARAVLGETGIDMGRFPTEGQFMSWGCMVPRSDESAGKRRSSRMRPGGNWLKTTMVQCAWAAVRKSDCTFAALFARLKPRSGAKRAICAVAAEMLRTIYHMLKDGTFYQERRLEHRQASREREADRLIRRLARLGFSAQITPVASAAA
jgi:transposase